MADGVATLTEREREVLRLLLAGHTAKSAATELGLSVHTVNDYLREARKKLGVASSREAARILGEQEASAPQNLAPEQIGMGGVASPPDSGASRNPRPRIAMRRGWIIGGLAMLALLGSALIYIASSGAIMNQAEAEPAAHSAEDRASETAARAWLVHLDDGDWVASWNEASSIVQDALTAQAWEETVKPVRAQVGALISRELQQVTVNENVPGAPPGTYRILQFQTDFAKAPGRTETVVLAEEEGGWKVAGYFIR